MMLAALIYGDIVERIPTMKDAVKYKQNGNKVYSFYLDAETQWDFTIGAKPRYNGTGHGRDVQYVFGSGRATKLSTFQGHECSWKEQLERSFSWKVFSRRVLSKFLFLHGRSFSWKLLSN